MPGGWNDDRELKGDRSLDDLPRDVNRICDYSVPCRKLQTFLKETFFASLPHRPDIAVHVRNAAFRTVIAHAKFPAATTDEMNTAS
jgi:hypothetical protein